MKRTAEKVHSCMNLFILFKDNSIGGSHVSYWSFTLLCLQANINPLILLYYFENHEQEQEKTKIVDEKNTQNVFFFRLISILISSLQNRKWNSSEWLLIF